MTGEVHGTGEGKWIAEGGSGGLVISDCGEEYLTQSLYWRVARNILIAIILGAGLGFLVNNVK